MANTIDASATGDQLLAFGVLLGRSGKVIESEISGTSMGSSLPSGCRIRIRPLSTDEYRRGQVVAFVTGRAIFAHRIVHRSRQGVLTRGDSHSWCDQPVPVSAILGVVSERQVNGEWHLFDDSVLFECDKRKRSRIIETLLLVCLQMDIRLARRASKFLLWLARWRRRLVQSLSQPRELAK
jgi:hypothetical protein